VTTELYCPPGQQQQDIGSKGGEKACFACSVGTYQPLRSKAPCQPCPFGAWSYAGYIPVAMDGLTCAYTPPPPCALPHQHTKRNTGADCLRQGIEYPVPMPGFWRQPLSHNDALEVDPFFTKYRIYECNPPGVCLGASSHVSSCLYMLDPPPSATSTLFPFRTSHSTLPSPSLSLPAQVVSTPTAQTGTSRDPPSVPSASRASTLRGSVSVRPAGLNAPSRSRSALCWGWRRPLSFYSFTSLCR
jgi:hypothetical protein